MRLQAIVLISIRLINYVHSWLTILKRISRSQQKGFFFLCFLISSNRVFPQFAILKGNLQDSILGRSCALASVVILNGDSTVLAFTRSYNDGRFLIKGVPEGYYMLNITYPYHVSYLSTIKIGSERIKEIGTIALLPIGDSLSPVIVTPRNTIMRMKHDTLEYNTENMRMNLNATVEDLLKRLPGVQVDAHGIITVNGEQVKRLMIDGEDLFGGEPTLMTKNLNSDMISKIQVLDKKNKEAEFTGINKGDKTKTINLVLKENSRMGYFGKIEGGGAANGYYNSNGLLGTFQDKKQIAVLGMLANTGASGFSGMVDDKGSDLNLGISGFDALGASAGAGVPKVIAAGGHFSNRWNGNNDHVVSNYQYGNSLTRPMSSSIVEQILPDSLYLQNAKSQSVNKLEEHTLSGEYEFPIDSLLTMLVSIKGGAVNGQNNLLSTGNSYFNDTLVNTSNRNVISDINNNAVNGRIFFKFKNSKDVRKVFSILTNWGWSNNNTKGYLFSLNKFYASNGTLLEGDSTDQRKTIMDRGGFAAGSLNYTQPVWKNVTVGLSYGLGYDNRMSTQNTFNRGSGKYDELMDSLSSQSKNRILSQNASALFQGEGKHYNFTIGGELDYFHFSQNNILTDSNLHYQYFIFNPQAALTYNITDFKGVVFNYYGVTQQPSIDQLQSVINNNDPLHITIGNPSLRPGFSHEMILSYHNYASTIFSTGIALGFSTNSIGTKTYTDSLGRQISEAVNIVGNRSARFVFAFARKVKFWNFSISNSLSYSSNSNYVNSILSKNEQYVMGPSFSLGRYVPEKCYFQINSAINYSYIRSSINIGANTQYWSQSHAGEFGFFPWPGWEVNTTCNFDWRQKTSQFDVNNQTIFWNTFLRKSILRNLLTIRWQINDILNENAGVNWTINANQISQSQFNVIGRYYLFVVSYRFSQKSK